jgi:hypothetical protein
MPRVILDFPETGRKYLSAYEVCDCLFSNDQSCPCKMCPVNRRGVCDKCGKSK